MVINIKGENQGRKFSKMFKMYLCNDRETVISLSNLKFLIWDSMEKKIVIELSKSCMKTKNCDHLHVYEHV